MLLSSMNMTCPASAATTWYSPVPPTPCMSIRPLGVWVAVSWETVTDVPSAYGIR